MSSRELEFIRACFREGLRPPQHQYVWEWADEHRRLTTIPVLSQIVDHFKGGMSVHSKSGSTDKTNIKNPEGRRYLRKILGPYLEDRENDLCRKYLYELSTD